MTVMTMPTALITLEAFFACVEVDLKGTESTVQVRKRQ